MPRVVVKTLSGANTIEIQTPSGSTTVKELRHLLVQKHDKFKGCKLLYNGISLSGETKIEDLDGIEGKFITACQRRAKETEKMPQDAKASALQLEHVPLKDLKVVSSPHLRELTERPNAKSAKLEGHAKDTTHQHYTLLPGYESRPNPSPEKKKKRIGRETNVLHSNLNSIRRMHKCDVTPQVPAGDRSCFLSNDAIMNLELDPSLFHFQRIFDALLLVETFFNSAEIRPTLRAVASCVPAGALQVEDILSLSSKFPCLVSVISPVHCNAHGENITANCSECESDAIVTINDPWKAAVEKIPSGFRDMLLQRCTAELQGQSNKGKQLYTRKKLRQAWIFRKMLVNVVLALGEGVLNVDYSPNGLLMTHVGSMDMCKPSRCEWIGINLQSTVHVDMHAFRRFPADKIATNVYFQLLPSCQDGADYTICGLAPPVALKKTLPCLNRDKLSPEDLLAHLEGLATYKNQIVHKEVLPGRVPIRTPIDTVINSSRMLRVLNERGINHFFSHQAQAISSLLGKTNTVICTSTASGKSLCYLVPILMSILSRPEATALLLFPTKALGQDQLRNIRDFAACLLGDSFRENVAIYDGDTDFEDREHIRKTCKILLTNPDMLHCSILPVHSKFAIFLKNLTYCVIDEAHVYRGCFGCHFAFVMRRLRRICSAVYGCDPCFALTSATICNPSSHAGVLIGIDDIEEVSQDGSPSEERIFVLWNPPIILENQETKVVKKRKMKEEMRDQVRRARQERAFPPKLGIDSRQEQMWAQAVALGQSDQRLRHGLVGKTVQAINASINMSSTQEVSSISDISNLSNDWVSKKVQRLTIRNDTRRSSPIVEIAFLLAECVKHGIRTIAFCKTRKLSELVAIYTHEIVGATNADLVDRVAVYRAGYSPEERRGIERSIFNGSLLGVAATNALELGIDIGELDCTLHLGFPGSTHSLWQQAGRAGRRNQRSLSIYVGWEGPLDQYFMRHPDKLFGRSIEEAKINLANFQIVESHMKCASYELPLAAERDRAIFCEKNGLVFESCVKTLLESGDVCPHPGMPGLLHYCGKQEYPAKVISLRDIDAERYKVVDETSNKVLEEIEARKAFFVIYDGAIYVAQGKTYICKKLNLATRTATVRPTQVNYYTTTIDYTDVHVTGGHNLCLPPQNTMKAREQRFSTTQTPAPQCQGHACPNKTSATTGDAIITTRWMGYARIRRGTGQVFDIVDLYLPAQEYITVAVTLRLPPTARQRVHAAGGKFRDGVHAASHAVMNVMPLFLMCNPEDLGTECDYEYDTRLKPERILVFDRYPGGIGLSQSAQPIFSKLLSKAYELVQSCPCTDDAGCPACIQHVSCTEYNKVISKSMAVIILDCALSNEKENM